MATSQSAFIFFKAYKKSLRMKTIQPIPNEIRAQQTIDNEIYMHAILPPF
jgi:hypothetical protein